ncbi:MULTISPECIES: transcriptional regulator, SarA/Rot family [Mammaliicoccus]|jgi:MarR family transcriptional regulator|uniref:MarR family transcriptional regulator n=2 Tax=Mammaliicoccus lentus TaxID=42858 RepID=A0ABS6H1L1_MAMLE|nr:MULTISPECIES: MarR family transcriptional regulator [Mammaliicoccus]HBV04752.1 MarR family transcriptional regulator [Staphylococcus sp.]HIS19108.1 MarR family transcriptional regulator [Candidatus Coprovivens excrementavium]MBF0748276.1 MarR family transcriptional regulator [Mammaliicoccus lentus]MBF0794082.1 MarR family transcriptional regulator [Mammaliicoccus lentus]MBU6114953.1 MarR family transcriptional regulator [Mammaliicoccus lentus]
MEAVQIRNVVELVTVSKKAKEHLTKIKSQFVLTFEELYILVYIYKGEKDCYNVKDIIKNSKFKPYYISKAVQNLKEKGLISKKRNDKDERTVAIEVSKIQHRKIKNLLMEIEGEVL